MAENASSTALELISTSAETGEQTTVAKLELSPEGILKLLAAKPEQRKPLALAVQEINAREGLHMEVPPLPGTPQFAVASKLAPKTSPDYSAALAEYFRKYHDLTLEEV